MNKATNEMNSDYSYSNDKSTTELLVELDNERTGNLKHFDCVKTGDLLLNTIKQMTLHLSSIVSV